jgi:hypothetical protein
VRKILILLFLLPFFSAAEAAYLDLAWDLNHEVDLAGYRIYYGTSPGEYIDFVDVGLTTTYRLGNLLDDVTFYIVLTAYDSAGNESDLSEEVSGIGTVDDPLTNDSDYDIGGEPSECETLPNRSAKVRKSNPGSQKGRKQGWGK